ncbi:MAG: hypothetical protein WBV94_02720 [Blastocatellia bacterium]
MKPKRKKHIFDLCPYMFFVAFLEVIAHRSWQSVAAMLIIGIVYFLHQVLKAIEDDPQDEQV